MEESDEVEDDEDEKEDSHPKYGRNIIFSVSTRDSKMLFLCQIDLHSVDSYYQVRRDLIKSNSYHSDGKQQYNKKATHDFYKI